MRWIVLLGLVACTGDDTDVDTSTDTGVDTDDDSETDVDTDTEADTGVAVPLEGVGTITGDCGPLDGDDLLGTEALAFYTEIDLPSAFQDSALTDGGQYILDAGNLNQSSLYSEIFAFEMLARCELAELLQTETEVVYDNPQGKKTDLVVDIEGVRVGVSVVRAVGFPRDDPYTEAQALNILEDKLADVPIAADNASDASEWDRSILAVVAYSPDHVTSIAAALPNVSPSVRGDTILYVTATNGTDGFIYGD